MKINQTIPSKTNNDNNNTYNLNTQDDNISSLKETINNEIDFNKLKEICDRLESALKEILTNCGVYFRIFSRVKTDSSIANKLSSGNYTKSSGKKIQDIIGLRIVLYYYDDLKNCRNLMESTFKLDGEWSKTNYSAEEFKAAKINGVFQIPEEYFSIYNKELWSLPIDTTFEIQFRTVFFEGWHEIEHDMRYKSIFSDEDFWAGSEELSRMLNCILANLELCDWSLVELFEQHGYNNYKLKNWELMLKSHFRIKLNNKSRLNEKVRLLFDANSELAKKFFKCDRGSLMKELIKLDNPEITYDLIVYCINEAYVHDESIKEAYSDYNPQSEDRIYPKKELKPLKRDILYKCTLNLMHKDNKDSKTEFITAAHSVYKWARFKFNPVFNDIPESLTTYKNTLPGYDLNITFDENNCYFKLDLNHIDLTNPGTLWHSVTTIKRTDSDDNYILTHITSRDMPDSSSSEVTFVKPSFLAEISLKTGVKDCERLSTKPIYINTQDNLNTLRKLMINEERTLPIVVISMNDITEHTEEQDIRDIQNMNHYPINGTRLAKITGLYSHVYMLTKNMQKEYASLMHISEETTQGSVCVIWPITSKKSLEIYTKSMIYNTSFDFNKFSMGSKDLNEKAFRHKLVNMLKDYITG